MKYAMKDGITLYEGSPGCFPASAHSCDAIAGLRTETWEHAALQWGNAMGHSSWHAMESPAQTRCEETQTNSCSQAAQQLAVKHAKPRPPILSRSILPDTPFQIPVRVKSTSNIWRQYSLLWVHVYYAHNVYNIQPDLHPFPNITQAYLLSFVIMILFRSLTTRLEICLFSSLFF